MRLYLRDRLTLEQIAERFGVTKQAIHTRLKKAGVTMRQVGKRQKPRPLEVLKQKVDVPNLVHKYVTEGLSIVRIARQTGFSWNFVRMVLDGEEIKLRPKGFYIRRFPELYRLKKRETVVLELPNVRQPHSRFYKYASSAGIRVSVRKVGEARFELRRVG